MSVSVLDSTSDKEGACVAGCAPLQPRIRQPAGHGRRIIARLACAWGLDKTAKTRDQRACHVFVEYNLPASAQPRRIGGVLQLLGLRAQR